MIKILVCAIVLVAPLPLFAAGLDTPVLSAPLATARFFDPERLLTTAGVKYQPAGTLTLEPELGLGYRALERDLQGGAAEEIHKVHALAGWRLSLADTLYLSAAAKLPVYSYQRSGSYSGQSLGSRQDYDLVRSLRETPAWTGEMGVHLGRRADLTLYYDQGLVPGTVTGLHQQEERIGTRFIWHFE
ncbi:hypothetical protein GMLC_31280 [Geomonas limicola]|uniref:Outer membrane protein beta-barrel domain-containing protein n=1 Tax=Geomonas limicola TaxID=2740186 RepID=A0A6V8NEK0_9BACT|nr:hypothetical protein [Geomonas limicola]GFO69549.1 hypothetical protein GMLC_31280 [Geomonas limicola]